MAKSSNKSIPPLVLIIESALAVASVGLLVFGAMNTDSGLGLTFLASGAIGIILIGSTFAGALLLKSSVKSAESADNQPDRQTEHLLTQIYENSMLSDMAKRVLFRDRELELLRRAIEDDIERGDYNAGLTLCDDMANLFGHREEAEAFRTRIQQAGHAAFDGKALESVAEFDQILVSRDWGRAHQEAARIKRLYPNHHLVQDLDQRVIRARNEHKQELQTKFLDAATREDVESAMLMLKELDKYMTREEAESLSKVAEDIVVKHRDNLSMQFRLAVNDHRWSEAARIGDTIINEYPNTKMADEVRSMIDVLRVRASQEAVAASE